MTGAEIGPFGGLATGVASEGSSTMTPAGSPSAREHTMSPRHGRRRGGGSRWPLPQPWRSTWGLPMVASSANATPSTRERQPDGLCPPGQQHPARSWSTASTKDDLWAHMVKFQQIADANPGADGHPSRNSGEPGYKASADYVADVMRAAGYQVRLQEYKFHYFSFVGDPGDARGVADTASTSASAPSSTPDRSPAPRPRSSNRRAASWCPRRRPPARPAGAPPRTSPVSSPATSP